MALPILFKLWLLYLALDLFHHYCALCCNLGYQVVRVCVQQLMATRRQRQHERLLELREEVLDMDLQQRRLEAELEALPEELSDSSDPDESI